LSSGRIINPLTEELSSGVDGEDSSVIDDSRENSVSRTEVDEAATGLLAGIDLVSLPVPDLVEKIVCAASENRASDIHIERLEERCRLRFRVDGALHEAGDIPEKSVAAALSRIKIMCDMDIAEKRRPQDGRFRFPLNDRTIDVRVSSMPTDFGEKLVLRLLDRQAMALDLGQLGFNPEGLATFEKAIIRPQGIVLVTGPTGSGKTTTLYAALNRISRPELNIVTVEDPIEYNLAGVNQSQVKVDIGYTFANALRTFLRQDPNVIMVGEIRDSETVQIALRAAMTGHLVLSTVHTNDAATTLTRLLDLGAEPYLVASSLSLVLAQRLVRRLCVHCREADPDGPSGTYRSVGCPRCLHSGFRGRVGIFETMPLDDELRRLIHERAPAERIRETAHTKGMRLLLEAAGEKWQAGLTTREEIQREIGNIGQ